MFSLSAIFLKNYKYIILIKKYLRIPTFFFGGEKRGGGGGGGGDG